MPSPDESRFAASCTDVRQRWFLPLFAIFVLVLRLPYFNDPAIDIDEQFYLVVADKWVHQALLPFVDIWDRKPIGLFLIYALPAALMKNAVLGYQLLAAAAVIATGLVTAEIGRIAGNERRGIMAALIYALAVVLMDGGGGQAPVFYNLPVAMAALLYIRIAAGKEARPVRYALLGSLLFGLALQIKYLCVIEAVVLSAVVVAALRRTLPPRTLAALVPGMIVAGLLPTLLAAAVYAQLGHWPEFYASNFASIFRKELWNIGAMEFAHRFLRSSRDGIFFLPFAAYELSRGWRLPAPALWAKAAIALWLGAATIGALILGNPTHHYFLPTLAPLALLTAAGLARLEAESSILGRGFAALARRAFGYGGLLAVSAVPLVAAFVIAHDDIRARGEPSDVRDIASFIKRHTKSGCPFVFNRLPILYTLSDVCTPSVYAFPNHLSEIAEVRAAGATRLEELARVLAARPPLIFLSRPYTPDIDPTAIRMLEETLDEHYVRVFQRDGYRQQYNIYAPKPTALADNP